MIYRVVWEAKEGRQWVGRSCIHERRDAADEQYLRLTSSGFMDEAIRNVRIDVGTVEWRDA